ncbi:MAG: hypothetical protein ACLQDY_15720 [Streptosporangiaceae bacterium]
MLNESQWQDLTSENERIVDSTEFFGIHRATAASSAAPAAPARSGGGHAGAVHGSSAFPAAEQAGSGRGGTPHSSSPGTHGPLGTGSWAVRSLAARTRRWRSRNSVR